jgi:hypothetical protein
VASITRENRFKPACGVPECEGRHAIWLHELLKDICEEKGQVHLLQGDAGWRTPVESWMEDKMEGEEEVMFVNTMQQEEDNWQEPDDSWLELDREESGEEAGVYCIGACLREDDPGLRGKMEHLHEVTPPPGEEGTPEIRWWSPGPQRLQADEEDEEEIQYLVSLLRGGLEIGGEDPEPTQPRAEAAAAVVDCDRRALEGGSAKGESCPQESTHGSELPTEKEPRRGMPRKKEACGEQEDWETARRDAWPRELPTDGSEGEPEVKYTRSEESGRWIAEMTGSRDRGHREPSLGEINGSVKCER